MAEGTEGSPHHPEGATPTTRPRTILGGSVLLLLLALTVLAVAYPRGAFASSHTIHGLVQLQATSGSNVLAFAGTCISADGYTKLYTGTLVTVTAADQTVLATTTLGTQRDPTTCAFPFTVTVPDAPRYRIAVGRDPVGVLTLSRPQLAANHWNVTLTVGA